MVPSFFSYRVIESAEIIIFKTLEVYFRIIFQNPESSFRKKERKKRAYRICVSFLISDEASDVGCSCCTRRQSKARARTKLGDPRWSITQRGVHTLNTAGGAQFP